MKKIFFLLIFLLFLPLAFASTVTVDKGTYNPDEPVTVSVTGCLGSSFLTILNPSGQVAFSDQGNDDWETTYHASSDPSTGEYTLNAFCGAEEFSTTFKVEEEQEPSPSDGNGGGRRDRRCTPAWSCDPWSFCGADLTQTRACFDKNCLSSKTETQDCPKCQESWVCTIWSDCLAGKQIRKCYDEHNCGTTQLKPSIQKACQASVTGPPPVRVIPTPPHQFTPPSPPKVEVPKPTFWNQYKTWLIAIPTALILILAVIFLFLHFHKPKTETNINELKGWLQTELQKGVPKEELRKIVQQQNEWTNKEFNQAFAELKAE